MPAISAAAQHLIKDARLSTTDVASLKAAVQSGQASVTDVEHRAARFVAALEAGVGDALSKLLAAVGSRARVGAPIANLALAPGLLNGSVQLPRDKVARKDYVPLVQKALIALANRTGDPSLMMPKFGADGGWGTETETALKAFQGSKGLTPSGVVDLATAQALDQALRAPRIPPIFAGGVDPNPPGAGAEKDGGQRPRRQPPRRLRRRRRVDQLRPARRPARQYADQRPEGQVEVQPVRVQHDGGGRLRAAVLRQSWARRVPEREPAL